MEVAQVQQLGAGAHEAGCDQAVERGKVAAVGQVLVAEAPARLRVVRRGAQHVVQNVEVVVLQSRDSRGEQAGDAMLVLRELLGRRGFAAGAALGLEHRRGLFVGDGAVAALFAGEVVEHDIIFLLTIFAAMNRIYRWACTSLIVSIGLLSSLGVLLLIRAVSGILWSQEAAGWIQAIGSIAAIYGAFALSRDQHRKEALAEKSRREHEEYKSDNAELAARTLAIRNLVQIAYTGISSAQSLIAVSRSGGLPWDAEKHSTHIDQSRVVLDSLIGPNTEHLALITALNVSRTLSQVRNDMQYLGGTMHEEFLLTSTNSINNAYSMVGRLADIQTKMIEKCRKRGIPIDLDDFK